MDDLSTHVVLFTICKKGSVKAKKKTKTTLYLVRTKASELVDIPGVNTPLLTQKKTFCTIVSTYEWKNVKWWWKNRWTGVKKRLFYCSLYSPLKSPFRKKLDSSYSRQYILWDAHYVNRSCSVFVQSVTDSANIQSRTFTQGLRMYSVKRPFMK